MPSTECFENGECLGYPTTKAVFAICYRNFMNLVSATCFEDVCAHGLTLDEEALQEWIGYQDNSVSLPDQPLSRFWHSLSSLARHPQLFQMAIFTSDLDPAKNFAVARHFSEAHGYELAGVGASYTGLIRAEPPELFGLQYLKQLVGKVLSIGLIGSYSFRFNQHVKRNRVYCDLDSLQEIQHAITS